ncbi:hypothetical protein Oscil6304_1898 [Oscillatoria acuminata PCC 6304]|uniref:Uncharacterized protein n=1 Tax=Oscillatoria acuminata PCC 6304 TaxID=56110 RepID=K9TGN9_9CYAN|nr:hypothetical protein Oscil6304_1898 [Oscillatoria acuminata PCC 6304]
MNDSDLGAIAPQLPTPFQVPVPTAQPETPPSRKQSSGGENFSPSVSFQKIFRLGGLKIFRFPPIMRNIVKKRKLFNRDRPFSAIAGRTLGRKRSERVNVVIFNLEILRYDDCSRTRTGRAGMV